MKQSEKLQKVIDFAIDHGMDDFSGRVDEFDDGEICVSLNGHNYSVKDILFDREFAKAVFGEETLCMTLVESGGYEADDFYPGWVSEEKCEELDLDSYSELKSFEYHLQQAVVSDDPILYYYNFVTERREK